MWFCDPLFTRNTIMRSACCGSVTLSSLEIPLCALLVVVLCKVFVLLIYFWIKYCLNQNTKSVTKHRDYKTDLFKGKSLCLSSQTYLRWIERALRRASVEWRKLSLFHPWQSVHVSLLFKCGLLLVQYVRQTDRTLAESIVKPHIWSSPIYLWPAPTKGVQSRWGRYASYSKEARDNHCVLYSTPTLQLTVTFLSFKIRAWFKHHNKLHFVCFHTVPISQK